MNRPVHHARAGAGRQRPFASIRGLGRVALLTLVLAACEGQTARSAPPAASAEASDGVSARPFTSPPGFEPAFATSIPAGVQAEPGAGGAVPSDIIRFVSRVDGTRRDSAFLLVHVWPKGHPRDRVLEVVRTAAERVRIPGDRSELQPVRRHRWAEVEFDIHSQGTAGQPVLGWVALGERGGRWYHVIAQAPESLQETFLPKAEWILDRWRWAADGKGLTDADTAPRVPPRP